MGAPRLRTVSDTPRRVLGVVRVSKERDGMVSPEIQVTAIVDYCAARGYQLVDVVEGIDQSGSQRRSAWWPTLDRAVESVVDGTYDGIVVWKFSRTARNRLKWAVAVDKVEMAGGVLESATEQFDTATSAGRFARGMVAEMNAFEAERIGEVWVEAHGRRIASGRPHTGKRRFGYTYDREQKLHVPHPEEGPVLADLYRRYVAGESIYMLVQWLNQQGWRTVVGAAWADVKVRQTLDTGFAAGLFRYHGELHEGAHEALISRELWQAYLDARLARRKVPPRREGSPYLLSGLVRCARCGHTMTAYREDMTMKYDNRRGKAYKGTPVRHSWRCRHCKELGKGPTGYIAAWRLDEPLNHYLEGVAGLVEQDATERVLADTRRALMRNEVDRLARQAAQLQDALVRLAVSNAENPLPADAYAKARAELDERLATVTAALEAAGADSRRVTADPAVAAAGLLEQWEELPVVGRREVLRKLIDCIIVRTGPEPFIAFVPWEEARG